MAGQDNAIANYRVLLVDDEPFIRTMTARMLADFGCTQFVEVGNGREALAVLDRDDSHIDLILCDLSMPDMDGVEIVRHLGARKDCPPFAFLSGAESGALRAAEALARAYRLEVLGCLPKPTSKAALQSLLSHVSAEKPPRTKVDPIAIAEADLRRGIEAGELALHYQPKVSLETGRVSSVEGLVRWTHPHHGLLSPAHFVPLAETSGLIAPMTEHLIEVSFRQQAEWQSQGFHTLIGVNLSPSMLSDVTLPDRAAKLADSLGIAADSIVFEITETGVAKEELIYLEIVTRLHLKGFLLSIDDFGTGQSSLQKLEALPFNELKVDRQFVHGAHRNPAKRAILTASLGLARSLGLKTVAEGAEHMEDVTLLEELGCEVVQGFVMARPMPPHDVLAWARARETQKN